MRSDLRRLVVTTTGHVNRVGGQSERPAIPNGQPGQERSVVVGLPPTGLRPAGLLDQVRQVRLGRADDVEVRFGPPLVNRWAVWKSRSGVPRWSTRTPKRSAARSVRSAERARPSAAASKPITPLLVGAGSVLRRAKRDDAPHDCKGPASCISRTLMLLSAAARSLRPPLRPAQQATPQSPGRTAPVWSCRPEAPRLASPRHRGRTRAGRRECAPRARGDDPDHETRLRLVESCSPRTGVIQIRTARRSLRRRPAGGRRPGRG